MLPFAMGVEEAVAVAEAEAEGVVEEDSVMVVEFSISMMVR